MGSWSYDVTSDLVKNKFIQMIIGTDGSLSNVKVLRSVSPSLDAEAIRVVGNMPKWEPGMQKGQAVPVKYTLPITFRLQ